uniref:Uncharacterized protein n=1 Tax=Triticum urartu TaxID=4572 RepID=A0A8R7TZU2_TRIUA
MAGWLAVTMILLGRETAVLAELQRWLVVEMRWCSPVQPRAVGSCNGDLGHDGSDLARRRGRLVAAHRHEEQTASAGHGRPASACCAAARGGRREQMRMSGYAGLYLFFFCFYL